MTPLLSFRKDERLSGKKAIDRLFREGSSFFSYPFKVYWLIIPYDTGCPARVLVNVGKRAFKRAVDRNKVRRQIREAYRQNKSEWYEFLRGKNHHCTLALIYTPTIHLGYGELEKKIKSVFQRLSVEIDANLNNNDRYLSEQ